MRDEVCAFPAGVPGGYAGRELREDGVERRQVVRGENQVDISAGYLGAASQLIYE